MKNTIVYLIGYAGTGKYTIAKELAELTGAVLVDNHLINNLVFSVLGADRKTPLPASVWPKIESIRTSRLLRVNHPNCLELDVTRLSSIQAAQAIIGHVEKRAP